jgi:hypothetical protein
VHNAIISAVKRAEFFNDRTPYLILRGRSCDIIVLNVHAKTEDKYDDTKDGFYEELECVFETFPKGTHEYFVKLFHCKSEEGSYFKTNKWE